LKWDEGRFGLEYDLDIYMIVAVGVFYIWAPENKGVNFVCIFGKLVCAQHIYIINTLN
jgi:aminopeptidase N